MITRSNVKYREWINSVSHQRINIQGFIALIRARKYPEALDLIRETIPLPAVCGRICPHPCEDECRRGEVDEPVSICALKRFAFDYGSMSLEKSDDLKGEMQKASDTHKEMETQKKSEAHKENETHKKKKKRQERVAVIGSGPAGLAASYDLAILGYPVTIFESLPVSGRRASRRSPASRSPPSSRSPVISRRRSDRSRSAVAARGAERAAFRRPSRLTC